MPHRPLITLMWGAETPRKCGIRRGSPRSRQRREPEGSSLRPARAQPPRPRVGSILAAAAEAREEAAAEAHGEAAAEARGEAAAEARDEAAGRAFSHERPLAAASHRGRPLLSPPQGSRGAGAGPPTRSSGAASCACGEGGLFPPGPVASCVPQRGAEQNVSNQPQPSARSLSAGPSVQVLDKSIPLNSHV